jgi:hypothetical protein
VFKVYRKHTRAWRTHTSYTSRITSIKNAASSEKREIKDDKA